jgi:hypothetical protein
MEPNVSDYSCH